MNQKVLLGSIMAGALSGVLAFQPPSVLRASTTGLQAVVDPSVVTKKEYEDICGVSFDDETLHQRLKATNYLYPKHVEVIEDIAPVAAEMVDSVVSNLFMCWHDDGVCSSWAAFSTDE
jgi:hypothetical protein